MDFDFTQEIPGHVPEWYVILMVKWALDMLYGDEDSVNV